MITSNVDLSDRLIDGQVEIVYDFAYIHSTITKVYINLDDNKATFQDKYGLKQKIVPLNLVERKNKIRRLSSKTFKRTQFPLSFAWTCIVHKFQGLTLDTCPVSLELVRQRKFSPGQTYTALYHATSLSQQYIPSDFHSIVINANQSVLEHYENMRKEKIY